MKKIVLETYKIEIENKIVKSSDKELLKTTLNNYSLGGKKPTTFEILKKLDMLCNKIDKAKKELFLEEVDYNFLKEVFIAYNNWNSAEYIRKHIINIGEKLDKAEVYDPNENINKEDKKTTL